jgi:serine/threonine-protein kinase ATR
MDFAGVLNALFNSHSGARRRGLGLQTYAVLPLTEDCGILQWVNGLVPFKAACEEVYTAAKLYKKHTTPLQVKKMYDSFQGGSVFAAPSQTQTLSASFGKSGFC